MKLLAWRKKPWWNALVVVLTVVATIVLATHPELRLFLPLLDSLGLDLLVILVGAQVLDFVWPVLHAMHRIVVLPGARRLYRLVIFLFGVAGPYADALVASRFPALAGSAPAAST